MKLNCATMAAWPFYRYISEHPRLVLASVSCIAQPTLVENYLLSLPHTVFLYSRQSSGPLRHCQA